MRDETRDALRVFVEIAGDYGDAGPTDAPYQSKRLSSAVATVREYLDAPPRCATCRWATPREGVTVGDGPFTLHCEKTADSPMRLPGQDHPDRNPAWGKPVHGDTLAWAPDMEGMYGAALCVAPDFGCVMHEAKP